MKSRITIEVDFSNGNLPVIQILQGDSDDVRDKLVSQFLQSLQHTSRWCRIEFINSYGATSINASEQGMMLFNRWNIRPITTSEIQEEINLMKAVIDPVKGNPEKV